MDTLRSNVYWGCLNGSGLGKRLNRVSTFPRPHHLTGAHCSGAARKRGVAPNPGTLLWPNDHTWGTRVLKRTETGMGVTLAALHGALTLFYS